MLHVVSVSLGSARRNGRAEIRLGGERLLLERIGLDGDWRRAARFLRELDGRVAAVGLGGVNDAYRLGDRAYRLPLAARLRRCLRRTPCADGTAWKRWAEPLFVERLAAAGVLPAGGPAVVTSVLDRWWLAEELADRGFHVRAGDAWFALGMPWLPGLAAFRKAAAMTLPFLRFLPLSWLYPDGDALPRSGNDPVTPGSCRLRAGRATRWALGRSLSRPAAAVLWAGDVRLLLRRLSSLRRGDLVLAAHAAAEEKALLRARGAEVVALNPVVDGFAPAANLWEAAVLAVAGGASFASGAGGLGRAVAPGPSLIRAFAGEVMACCPTPGGSAPAASSASRE